MIKRAIKKIYRFLCKPTSLAVINGVLIAIIVICNFLSQAFCIPVPWAVVVIAICFTNTILYPILERTKLAPLTSFINGVSICLFLYCVIFIGAEWTFMAFLFIIVGIGLIIFIPHFFVFQLVLKNLINPAIKTSRYFCLSAIIICMGIVAYIGYDYKKAVDSIEKFKASGYKELDKNFMTEKILGMHFIYHTEYCPYDGWRPPIHEPIMVIGKWFYGDPLEFRSREDLRFRIKLYKEFFPDKKDKYENCIFMKNYLYYNDDIWNKKNYYEDNKLENQ